MEHRLARILEHGGDVDGARALFPQAPEPWIDLSTGINPVPYPVGDVPASAWTRLPGKGALAALISAAAKAYGAADPATVIAAPGTQALIQLLPRLIAANQVAVLGPTYGEHAAVWRAAGAEVWLAEDPSDLTGSDVAVIVNPNNPDGRLLSPDQIAQIATTVRTLVVDEAFVDVVPGASLIPHGLPANTVVLRSFGKSYGLAGVRLGFAVASPVRAAAIAALLGPWAVPGPAIEIGTLALSDPAWLDGARARLEADAARLDGLLSTAGLAQLGGTPLFRLARTDRAAAWFERLAARGILVRPFDYAPTWLRFGLPADEAAWGRLSDALMR